MNNTISEAKETVINAGLKLCKEGLVARTWGNISSRISETEYVITPSGKAYDQLTEDEIVKVNLTDGSYSGHVKPSGEKGVHEAVYQLRPEAEFVIHTHQNYASALSIMGKNFKVTEQEAVEMLGNVIPCAGYGMYGSKQLIRNVTKVLKENPDSRCLLMRNHGALCFGKDEGEAFAIAYKLEQQCKKIYENLCGETLILKNRSAESHCEQEMDSKLKEQLKTEEIIYSAKPYTVAMSGFGEVMEPYIDDLAQIGGVTIRCIDTLSVPDCARALKNRNAVLVKGKGAVCTGKDRDDAEAVATVLEKACMAAYLAKQVKEVLPLSKYHASADRKGYVNSYSKLK